MQNNQSHFRFFLWAIPVALLIGFACYTTLSKGGWNEIISSDGHGYYHYFLEFFISDENRDQTWEKSYLSERNGQHFTKYSVGTSLLLSPFFAMAYGVASITGHELTGYSTPFHLFVRVGSLFYLIFGSFLLYRLLLTYSFKKQTAYITVLAILFGTNLLYYGVVVSAKSHVYSFATIAGLALFIRLYFKTEQTKYLLLASLMLGIVALLRPFNILVLLALPMLVVDQPNWTSTFRNILRYPKPLIVGALVFCAVVSIQPLAWYQQTGQWMLYGYVNEGFYFDNPEVLNVLFSFNKGLFTYTPLLLIAMVGVWPLYRLNRKIALSFVLFFLVITYFISSWWCWNYASHFGLRPYVDFYAFFAIPLAAILGAPWRYLKPLISLVVLLLIALNLIQSYQTKAQILHPIGMSFQQYKYVFLRTGERYENCLGGHSEVPIFAPNGLEVVHSGTIPTEVMISTEFPKGMDFEPSQLLAESDFIHLRISLEKFEFDQNPSSEAMLVLEFRNEESKELTYYYAFKLNDTPLVSPEKWNTHSYIINTQSPSPQDKVSCYIWNREKERFKVRNFQVEILTAR